MTFSKTVWADNQARYDAILAMPFNAELTAGTLSRERFVQYIVQDAHYLIGFGRALAVAAAKADDPDRMVQFTEAAREAVVVERALHGSFFADWGITADAFAATPLAPAAHHYVSFLIATAFREPYEVVLASLLPCFWIYAEVGTEIHAKAAADNPYRAWIDTYAGEEFQTAVNEMIAATDEAAAAASPERLAGMHEAYAASTRLEYMFWDSAYRLERWPL